MFLMAVYELYTSPNLEGRSATTFSRPVLLGFSKVSLCEEVCKLPCRQSTRSSFSFADYTNQRHMATIHATTSFYLAPCAP